ncbi:MAG: type I glyceraldehyde-3-phosphate dehydrogenase [Nanoarchaeota archaeon]|nr:type I glyceraldehyde-3-phosphate dehydrogenase [Nanoarchaeota archaeon]
MIRVAINGFGRIGRLVLRAGIEDPKIQFVAINDLADPGTLSHLLRFDSIHGRFKHDLFAYKDIIKAKGQDIKVFSEKDPEKLPWKKLKIDVVIEATGFFRTKEGMMKHIKAGAKKVILSAPVKGDGGKEVKTIVLGVNEKEYKGENLVSNASCTTNCFAPLVKIIHDNLKLKSGVMTTVHAYTSDQKIQDSPHNDLRRGKAAALNIVPTSTGAAKAVTKVIPEMEGRLAASAIRVPTPDGSLVNFVLRTEAKKLTKERVNKLFLKASKNEMKGILEYSEESLVSTDIIGNSHSCIFDSQLTTTLYSNMVSLTAWYDNEWGYSCRVIDLIKYIIKHK